MKTVKGLIIHLFKATDGRIWEEVKECFDTKVTLDYSSMNGQPAVVLSSEEIVSSWKTILPGFSHTHHQLGNFEVTENNDKARVSCYGTASHYLEDDLGNLWTVVGSYDFQLKRQPNTPWKVTSMTFHFKFQDGNVSLPERAMNNCKT
jgi:hypothetical protein